MRKRKNNFSLSKIFFEKNGSTLLKIVFINSTIWFKNSNLIDKEIARSKSTFIQSILVTGTIERQFVTCTRIQFQHIVSSVFYKYLLWISIFCIIQRVVLRCCFRNSIFYISVKCLNVLVYFQVVSHFLQKRNFLWRKHCSFKNILVVCLPYYSEIFKLIVLVLDISCYHFLITK